MKTSLRKRIARSNLTLAMIVADLRWIYWALPRSICTYIIDSTAVNFQNFLEEEVDF